MRAHHWLAMMLGIGLLFGVPVVLLGYGRLLELGAASYPPAVVMHLNFLELGVACILLGLAGVLLGRPGSGWTGTFLVIPLGVPTALLAWLLALVSFSSATGNPL